MTLGRVSCTGQDNLQLHTQHTYITEAHTKSYAASIITAAYQHAPAFKATGVVSTFAPSVT